MAEVDEASKELFVFTMSAKTGQIVKFESVNGAGARHEISEDEWRKLAKQKTEATLEKLLEEAFEAGIACALGSDGRVRRSSDQSHRPGRSLAS